MKITTPAVQAELDSILKSRCFRSRKTAQRFLTYVVKETLQGHGETINQFSIATEALGKDTDFDPTSNPLIRVQAGRLRKQLDEYYTTEGRDHLIRITLPTGSYQPSFIHRDEHNIKSDIQAYTSGVSLGPTLVCVPRLFTRDEADGWQIITHLVRDYVTHLTHFNFCQILFADEHQSQSQTWPDAAWNDYKADFALLFDLFDKQGSFSLKCSLAHSQTRQIVWAETFTLDQQDPEQGLLKIYRRIAHDTVSLEQGVAHNFWARQLLDSGKPIEPHHEVMIAMRKRIWNLTPKTLHDVRLVCEKRLHSYSQDVQAYIVYADLCRTDYLVKYGEFDPYHESVKQTSNQLLLLAPGNAYSHMFYAAVNALEQQFDISIEHLRKAVEISPLDTHLGVGVGLLYIVDNEWETGIHHIQQSIDTSPIHPDWYHIPMALYHYRNNNYLEAMKEIRKSRTHTCWETILRAAAYRLNDQTQLFNDEMQNLDKICPDFDAMKDKVIDSSYAGYANKTLSKLLKILP